MIHCVISDMHAPYQDKYAIELACKLIEYVKPARVTVAGDRTDFYAISPFDRDPARILKLQSELDEALKIGMAINDAAGEAPVEELWGNHEKRWLKYLLHHPELTSLRVLTLPAILEHERLGWSSPDKDRVDLLHGRLRIKHGELVRKHSGWSAKAELEKLKYQVSVVMGHTHRMGAFYATGPRHTVGGWEIGCLCSLKPTWINDPDWQQGICFIEMNGSNADHHFQVHPIVFTGKSRSKRARFWNKEFTAR